MEKEDYVSYDVAKLLREVGFTYKSNAYYETGGVFKISDSSAVDGFCGNFVVPSLYEAQKWLRKKELEVSANFDTGEEKWFSFVMRFDSIETLPEWSSNSIYNTYEDALNDGIREALKYI